MIMSSNVMPLEGRFVCVAFLMAALKDKATSLILDPVLIFEDQQASKLLLR